MTIEKISDDGIGVRALLTVAERIADLVEEYKIDLGVIEGEVVGEEYHVPVVIAQRQIGDGPTLGVSIARNPKIYTLGDEEEVKFHA